MAGVKRSGACGPGLGQAPKRAKLFRERLNPVNMYGGGPFYTKGTSAANSVSDLFRSRFYNRGEIGSLQSGAADEAAVHVRLGYQLVGVLGATAEQANEVCSAVAVLPVPMAQTGS